jgi:NAD(P)-dependent dehydrogenase (short-subunit alcohol dehydrogenase family)
MCGVEESTALRQNLCGTLMRRNQGGAIVNVASVRSVVSGDGNVQYDTTKTGSGALPNRHHSPPAQCPSGAPITALPASAAEAWAVAPGQL